MKQNGFIEIKVQCDIRGAIAPLIIPGLYC